MSIVLLRSVHVNRLGTQAQRENVCNYTLKIKLYINYSSLNKVDILILTYFVVVVLKW